MFKTILAVVAMLAAVQGGVVPALPLPYAAYSAPYATSYNAHAVTHSVAAPVAAAYTAPLAYSAPLTYGAHPLAYSAAHPLAYSAYPGAAAYTVL